MHIDIRTLLIVVLAILSSSWSSAQTWSSIKESAITPKGLRPVVPERYDLYTIDDAAFKRLLWTAPNRSSGIAGTAMILPTAGGAMDTFTVVTYDLLAEGLATNYPDIRAFVGVSTTDPYRKVTIDYTAQGVRALIRDRDGLTYIDHYQRNDLATRIIYRKQDLSREGVDWSCQVLSDKDHNSHRSSVVAGDCQFRQYRLAVSTTGEYSNYHGATSAAQSGLVLSALTTTINRVNEVYRQDVHLEMQLVANTDVLFFYNPATDPFSGSSGNKLNQNQAVVDNGIGNASYDIGHVVDTGDGGVAQLNSVCNNSGKARGYTGRNEPEGDPFDIDYVAHELGHQYGANHTQNNNCNRVGSTAMEPGSASTIMGYAGICSPNVQNNSDAYFHAVSIAEMVSRVTSTSCATILPNPNTAPVITPLPDYTIPAGTPFVLEAVASDPDGDPLLYCWEQYDNEVTSNTIPSSTWTSGPVFRSFSPSSSPARYLPRLSDLSAGIDYDWEELPTVNRDMSFRLTVRDVPTLGGCTEEIDIIVTTTTASGPFVVTDPSTTATYAGGDIITVVWSVAGTDLPPVACTSVDILYAADGINFDSVLVAQTPNDGSEDIILPAIPTFSGKLMVRCHDGIIYNVTDGFIQIPPENCTVYMSSDIPVAISDNGTPTISSTLAVPDVGAIIDLNITDLQGTHTYINDLRFTLTSPTNKSAVFWNRPCGSENNFDISFDDQAASNDYPCPPTDGDTYLPDVALLDYIGDMAVGQWTLLVEDLADQDGGELTSWGLTVCGDRECDLAVTTTASSGPGSLTEAYSCAIAGDTIRFMPSIDNSSILLTETLMINKDIVLLSEATGLVLYTDDEVTLQVTAGSTVGLVNFRIECESAGACLDNTGVITLTDMGVENLIQSGNIINTGQLLIKGNTQLD